MEKLKEDVHVTCQKGPTNSVVTTVMSSRLKL